MSSDENNVERIEQPKEQADKPALSEKEGSEVQKGAADQATERRRFLESSLGKSFSPSTSMLVNIVPEIYDGVKKIVGFLADETPKVDLEGASKDASQPGGVFLEINQLPSLVVAKAGPDVVKDGSSVKQPGDAAAAPPAKDAGAKTDDAGKKADDAGKKADDAGARTKDAGPAKAVDQRAMERAAEAIHKACDGPGTDRDTIYAVLKDKTEAERKAISDIYLNKYKITLDKEFEGEMSGAQLDKAMNLLHRKDGSSDRAGRIHEALLERAQLIEGRSDRNCEKDIRDTLATMNSDQIEQLRKDYLEKYKPQTLDDALAKDPHLSEATKEAVKVYLKGTDHRDKVLDEKTGKWVADPNFGDTMKLAQAALKAENIDMFQEAMRSASPEARQSFLTAKDADGKTGEQKIKDAFWGADEDHALEYARSGELSLKTILDANQSWLGDNEDAIEQALGKMKDSERADYVRGKALAADKKDPDSLSPEDKKALEFYTKVHASLDDAGNDAEMARWEDIIINKGGSLAGKLTSHRGSIYDDSINDVITDIENMSEKDWNQLKGKDGQRHREEIEKSLKTYLSDDDVKRCMEVVDKKMAAGSFEEASASGRRALTDIIKDSKGVFNDNEESIFNAISKMTPAEQEKYRTDEAYRKQVDEKINDVLDKGPEQDAARAMLDKVLKGQAPTEDIVSKLNRHAAQVDTDEAQVVRDLQKEFREHPELRDQIMHPDPNNPEQVAFAEKFMKSLHAALDKDEFEMYAKPLLETGHLPLEVQNKLNKGVFDDDEQGFYKDALALAQAKDPASKEEVKKILNDKEYQDKVFGALNDDERQIALNILKQGEMRPEDKLFSYMVGAGTSEKEIKEVLAHLTPEEKEQVKKDYALKYASDLTADLLDELGGQDAVDAMRALKREPQDAQAAFDDARDEYYKSRDGVGRAWVDSMWDGTGYQADESLNTFAKSMTEYSAKFQELPPAEQKRLVEDLQHQIDMFKESKGGVADGVTDASIAIVCGVGGFFTKGGTWVLLGALIAGGMFKAGVKAMVVGSDYDGATAVKDFAAGGVDAALNFLTLGAGAHVLKMGEKAGMQAAKMVLKEAAKEGGEKLLKEGVEKALEKGMVSLVRESIKDGSYKISQKAVEELVQQVAKEGATEAQQAALRKAIKESLDVAVKEEAENTIKKLAQQYLLHMESGAEGGFGSGTVQGFAQWDSNKTFDQNMAQVAKTAATSAAIGAGGAVVASTVFKVGGAGYHAIKEHYNLQAGERLSQKQLAEAAEKAGYKEAHYKENGDLVFEKPAKAGDVPPAKTKPGGRDVVPDKLDDAQNGIKNAEVLGKSKEQLNPGATNATQKSVKEVLERVPADHQFPPGEKVLVEGERGRVLGRDGDKVVVGQPKGEVVGHGTPEGQYDLKKFQKIEAGDHTYYKSENGEYYRLNKNKELVLDSDVKAVPRDKVDGVVRDIVFHDPGDSQDGKARLRKEMAAYKINQMMELENGFPVTTPKEINGVQGVAQEYGGKSFEDEIRRMAEERYPRSEHAELYKRGGVDEAVSKMLREDPELRKAVEEAYVERILLGDNDPNGNNFVISKDANGKYKVQNIDLDEGFATHPDPEVKVATGGVSNKVFLDLSEKPLSPELRQKIAKFVEHYDNPEGRQQLLKAGLKPDEADAYLARARALAETGKVPRAKLMPDVLQPVEIGTRHGQEVVAETYGDKVVLHKDVDQPQLNFKSVSDKELSAYQQVHSSDMYRGDDGKYYRVRKSADGKSLEIAEDPSLREMPRKEFLAKLDDET